jgi:hypothetical protein
MTTCKIPPNLVTTPQPVLFRRLRSRLKYLSISKNKLRSISRWLSASD